MLITEAPTETTETPAEAPEAPGVEAGSVTAVSAPDLGTETLIEYIRQHAALLEEMAAGLRKIIDV